MPGLLEPCWASPCPHTHHPPHPPGGEVQGEGPGGGRLSVQEGGLDGYPCPPWNPRGQVTLRGGLQLGRSPVAPASVWGSPALDQPYLCPLPLCNPGQALWPQFPVKWGNPTPEGHGESSMRCGPDRQPPRALGHWGRHHHAVAPVGGDRQPSGATDFPGVGEQALCARQGGGE